MSSNHEGEIDISTASKGAHLAKKYMEEHLASLVAILLGQLDELRRIESRSNNYKLPPCLQQGSFQFPEIEASEFIWQWSSLILDLLRYPEEVPFVTRALKDNGYPTITETIVTASWTQAMIYHMKSCEDEGDDPQQSLKSVQMNAQETEVWKLWENLNRKSINTALIKPYMPSSRPRIMDFEEFPQFCKLSPK